MNLEIKCPLAGLGICSEQDMADCKPESVQKEVLSSRPVAASAYTKGDEIEVRYTTCNGKRTRTVREIINVVPNVYSGQII